MSKQEELFKLDRTIKDFGIKLRTAQTALESVRLEIQQLINARAQLEENIEYLKNHARVASATEFKQVKQELAKIKIRLNVLLKDQNVISSACQKIDKELQLLKNQHVKLSDNNNNVIQGKFKPRES
jgi:chromosome segregation ATPase